MKDGHDPLQSTVLSLNEGHWRVTCPSLEHDPLERLSLPASPLASLLDAGRIADFLQGYNEDKLRWTAMETWTFQRTFTVSKAFLHAHARQQMVLDGVDTVAAVMLNGKDAAQMSSAHRQHRMDVKDAVVEGVNDIRIVIRSAVTEAADRAAAYPYPVPFVQAPRALPHYNFLRKPASDFGWDWGPAFAPAGLGGVTLVGDQGIEILGVSVRQDHASEASQGNVLLCFDVLLEPAAGACTLQASALDGPSTWRGSSDVPGGACQATVLVRVTPPFELWWPNGYGGQRLYRFRLSYSYPHGASSGGGSISRDVAVGLRSIRLLQERLERGAPQEGRTFEFQVNNVPIFAKGANVIPPDVLPCRVTPQALRQTVRSAAAAHMNFLRVWGGGGYLPGSFYEACDEAGILIWQEAMFACAFYPRNEAFVEEVGKEIRYQAWRLGHHPCLALWGGNNELEPALGWFPESRQNPILYAVDFAELFVHTVREAVLEVNKDIIYLDSSPSNGLLSETPYVKRWGDSGDVNFGDVHFYDYASDCLDPATYPRAKFISEFGFQSWPSWPVYKGVTHPEDWDRSSAMSYYRMRHPNGIAELEQQLRRHFHLPPPDPTPNSAELFQQFIYLTQIQQGLCYETAICNWRALKSDPQARTMGVLYWQLNDIWPGPSWSTLDFGGGWKLGHHFARRFYAPLLLWGHFDRTAGTVRLHLVSDLLHAAEGVLHVEVIPWAAERAADCRTVLQRRAGVERLGSKVVLQIELLQLLRQAEGPPMQAAERSRIFLRASFRPDPNLAERDSKGTAAAAQSEEATCQVFLTEFKDAALPLPTLVIDSFQEAQQPDASLSASFDVRATTVAVFVALECDGLPGTFSDNAFLLLPWEPRRVTFTSAEPFLTTELQRAITAVSLGGTWRE